MFATRRAHSDDDGEVLQRNEDRQEEAQQERKKARADEHGPGLLEWVPRPLFRAEPGDVISIGGLGRPHPYPSLPG